MAPSEPFTLAQQPTAYESFPFSHIYILGVPQIFFEGDKDYGLHFTDADIEAWWPQSCLTLPPIHTSLEALRPLASSGTTPEVYTLPLFGMWGSSLGGAGA